MLCDVLNKFRKKHPKKQMLYYHLSPISQIILEEQETLTDGRANVGQPAKTSKSPRNV